MMTDTAQRYAVWTANDDPEWIKRNTVPDMMITGYTSLRDAHYTASRLSMIINDRPFEIRDIHGSVVTVREAPPTFPGGNPVIYVDSVSPRPAPFRPARPARRLLGRGVTQ